MSRVRGGAPVARIRGGAPVSRVTLFRALKIHFSQNELHASLNQPRKSNLCFNLDFFANPLAVPISLLVSIQIYLAVTRICRVVVSEYVHRVLTGVETLVANIRRVFLVLFADFVLKTTAFQVIVKAFVAFHLLFVLLCGILSLNHFTFAADWVSYHPSAAFLIPAGIPAHR